MFLCNVMQNQNVLLPFPAELFKPHLCFWLLYFPLKFSLVGFQCAVVCRTVWGEGRSRQHMQVLGGASVGVPCI